MHPVKCEAFQIMSESIPNHIVQCHILPLLSSKSLIRFTCVCKSWHSFIYDPSFPHLRKPTYHILFVSHDPQANVIRTSQLHVFSVPFHQPNITTPPRATLLFTLPNNLNFSETHVQCVNSLLCFHPRDDTWFSLPCSAFTLIANPTTRQVVTLPIDESIGNREFQVSTDFGYDPLRDQFKVLRFLKYRDGSHKSKIFTLGVDTSWRFVTSYIPFIMIHGLFYVYKRNRGLCVNGTTYWTFSSDCPLCVVAFDVGTEQFRMMLTPSTYYYRRNIPPLQYPALVKIDGCLNLIGYNNNELKLWNLKDCKAQVWEQKSIVLPSGIVAKEQLVFPLCRVHTGEILLLPYFLPRRVRGIYYDMEKMSYRKIVVMEMPQPLLPDGELNIFFCEESFRLLK